MVVENLSSRGKRALRKAALLLLLAMSTVVSEASAGSSPQDIAASQQAYREGSAAELRGDWLAAREAYQRSIDRHDTPRGRLHLARAEANLGHLIEAFGQYQATLDSRAADPSMRAAASKEQKAVAERIPHLTVHVPRGFSGKVSVDHLPLSEEAYGVAFQVNPGTRVVVAEGEGKRSFSKTLVVPERGNAVVTVEFAPSAKTEPTTAPSSTEDPKRGSQQATFGYISLGVGAVSLAFGVGFALASRSAYWQVKEYCEGNLCAEEARRTYDHGRMEANIATVGFIAGGVFTAGGLLLLLTRPSKNSPSVSANLGLTSVQLQGAF